MTDLLSVRACGVCALLIVVYYCCFLIENVVYNSITDFVLSIYIYNTVVILYLDIVGVGEVPDYQ